MNVSSAPPPPPPCRASKGHIIINTVDCCSPNGNCLPTSRVDLLLTDFAGGASGFPQMFTGGKYDTEWQDAYMVSERRKLLRRRADIAAVTAARSHIPFAGYFVEAHWARRTRQLASSFAIDRLFPSAHAAFKWVAISASRKPPCPGRSAAPATPSAPAPPTSGSQTGGRSRPMVLPPA